ncbi:MAG TPA: hypothetical protein VF700_02020, partial [Segetibacter sp.]
MMAIPLMPMPVPQQQLKQRLTALSLKLTSTKSIIVMNSIYILAFLLLFQFSFACNHALEIPQASFLAESLQKQKRDKAGAANTVFKSADGGQTWQDISKGLPENLRID